jgi:hypothetical protein
MSRVSRPNPGGVSIMAVVCVFVKHHPAVSVTATRALDIICARCGKQLS